MNRRNNRLSAVPSATSIQPNAGTHAAVVSVQDSLLAASEEALAQFVDEDGIYKASPVVEPGQLGRGSRNYTNQPPPKKLKVEGDEMPRLYPWVADRDRDEKGNARTQLLGVESCKKIVRVHFKLFQEGAQNPNLLNFKTTENKIYLQTLASAMPECLNEPVGTYEKVEKERADACKRLSGKT